MTPFRAVLVVAILFTTSLTLRRSSAAWTDHFISPVTLDGQANWVVSDADRAVLALNTSLLDVERDFYKVLGYPPLYVSVNSTADPLVPAGSITSIYFGTPTNTPYLSELLNITTCLDGPESHCLRVVKDPRDPTGQRFALVAIGEGVRGAIYAAYSFSEVVLGVDPVYRFSGIQPDYKKSVELAGNFSETFSIPVFEYRVLFPNDEDLLGGFFADPLGETVYTLTAFDWFFETTLRLKANGIIVGTVPYPDEKSISLACRRGLVVVDHHFNLLGLNTYRWPREMFAEWNWQTGPGAMSYAWRASAQSMSRLDEVIWSVGYRGLGDYAAPCEGCSDSTKARLISEAIGNQTGWITGFNPEKPQQYMTYMWDEGLKYLSEGYLKLPEEVSIILSDHGSGHIGGLDQYASISEGVYTHVAMHDGWTNQLTEVVPPSRHFDQLGQFIRQGRKSKYIILNTSDLRPVLLTAEGVMRFVWNPARHTNGSNPQDAQTKFIEWWSARQFGVNATIAAQITNLYNTYFSVPYINTGISDEHLSGFTARIACQLSVDLTKTGNVSADLLKLAQGSLPKSLPELQNLYNQSRALFSQLQSENLLSQDRANFFQAHILTQFALQLHSNEALNYVAMGIIHVSGGNESYGRELLDQALASLDDLFEAQRAAETGIWRGVFLHSRLSDFPKTRTCVRKGKAAVLRTKTLPPQRPTAGYTFTSYQFAHQPNFPLFYAKQEWRMDDYVRVSCSNNDSCWNNATGGFFRTVANVTMKVLRSDAEVHYTVDGSDPTSKSPIYTKTLSLTETTQLKACAVVNGSAQTIITDAAYWKVD